MWEGLKYVFDIFFNKSLLDLLSVKLLVLNSRVTAYDSIQ